MTAPEIFTGSGTLRGSGFLTHRQTDSTPKLNGHEIVEIVPLTIETNDISRHQETSTWNKDLYLLEIYNYFICTFVLYIYEVWITFRW
jgi:hypothetical protein